MELQNRQHFWFWIAAACLVGSVFSLRPRTYEVVENAVKATPTQVTSPVYRTRAALPAPDAFHAETPLSLPEFSSGSPKTPERNPHTPQIATGPLLRQFPSLPGEMAEFEEAEFEDTGEVQDEQIVATNYEDAAAPPDSPLPQSIWLSGQIELDE